MQKFNSELNTNTTHSPLRSSRLPTPKKKLMSAFVLILSNHFKQTNCSQSRWGQTDLKIGHLGQVCTLCTFCHQTVHTALDRCLDHFQSKKMSKYHNVTSYSMTSNFKPPNISSERACLGDYNTENRSSL